MVFKLGELRATVSDWMSTDYMKGALAAGAGLFAEETITNMLLSTIRPTGLKATLLKAFSRLGMSALYYYIGKKYDRPLIGLLMSVGPVVMVFVDAIAAILKMTPAQAGASLAARLGGWKATAYRSAGVVRVVTPPAPAQPSQAPSASEEYQVVA